MNGLKGEEVSQVVVMGREFQEEGKAGAKVGTHLLPEEYEGSQGGAGVGGGGVRDITGFWNTQEVLS